MRFIIRRCLAESSCNLVERILDLDSKELLTKEFKEIYIQANQDFYCQVFNLDGSEHLIMCNKSYRLSKKNILNTIKSTIKNSNFIQGELSKNIYNEIRKLSYDIHNFFYFFYIFDKIYFDLNYLSDFQLYHASAPFLSDFSSGEALDKRHFYEYTLKTNTLSSILKPELKFLDIKKLDVLNAKTFVSDIDTCLDKLDMIITRVLSNKRIREDFCVFFSGGIDSAILAYYLVKNTIGGNIFLINTSFKKSSSIDRKNGRKAFEAIKKVDENNRLIFVENDISEESLIEKKETIKLLIKCNKTVMNYNIATVIFFTSMKAKELKNDLVFIGTGADELFGGYKRYQSAINLKRDLIKDFNNLSDNDLLRDYNITSYFNLNVQYPFLEEEVSSFASSLKEEYLINEYENKFILRNLLKKAGLEAIANIKKTAMQFGSGIKKFEKIFYSEGL